ncbi:uncharacterized protein LOC142989257 [Genypterus blacodes]|uniref:uncharacterized protein LOC142988665 n=1 Tax=Genypterus blacodes TaxID=154954 RepID=UPI003F760979
MGEVALAEDTAPAKAAKKTRKVAKKSGPTLSERILKLVSEDKSRHGMSLPALKKALADDNYDVEGNSGRVRLTIKRLLLNDKLIKVKASYKVAKPTEPKAKKPAVKKPAVKKPAAKKPAVKKVTVKTKAPGKAAKKTSPVKKTKKSPVKKISKATPKKVTPAKKTVKVVKKSPAKKAKPAKKPAAKAIKKTPVKKTPAARKKLAKK